jgi:glycosyltransferase involved in cell wall biosynthesis
MAAKCGREDAFMPLVSVVVPTHNRPEFLAEALASVRAQTFPDYEIIVASNGESAETGERSHAVAALHGASWFTLDEGNVSVARNFGVERAEGEWIAFLDDDDIWLPNKLERQVVEAHRIGADMVSSDYIEFYADGREIICQPRLLGGWSHTRGLNHLFWWAPPSGVIIRKSALDAADGFDPRLRYCEDIDLWRRVSWRHRIHHLEETLFRYRQGHASVMQHERTRYLYDLRCFFKSHFDTPGDLRDTLAGASFVWNRVMIICFPKWLVRGLELTAWDGIRWHLLKQKIFPARFRQWLRPRSRLLALRHRIGRKLRPRARINALFGREIFKSWPATTRRQPERSL